LELMAPPAKTELNPTPDCRDGPGMAARFDFVIDMR
jgi:hypothetical protein